MFTGIIEGQAETIALESGQLVLRPRPGEWSSNLREGESIAINGVCLTLLPGFGDTWRFDLSPETLDRTSLGGLAPGSLVNVERAMKADGRFGGHVVQGHVDATGEVLSVRDEANSKVIRFKIPAAGSRYLIDKGSITLEGVSLTVVRPEDDSFEVWLIPHTIAETNLGLLKPGDKVNLEYDVIAKYVERMTQLR